LTQNNHHKEDLPPFRGLKVIVIHSPDTAAYNGTEEAPRNGHATSHPEQSEYSAHKQSPSVRKGVHPGRLVRKNWLRHSRVQSTRNRRYLLLSLLCILVLLLSITLLLLTDFPF